jgi:3-(3-hydroxy-phenyl)propionate hydroxylase
MSEPDADVAVVGYGPVGAVLAGLLGKRGLRVLVLDRRPGLYPLPRAAHIDHTGLRVLQELGCLDRLLPQLLANPGTDCVNADRELLFRLPSDRPTISGLPASMYFYQPTFDAELRRASAAFPGVDVQLATEVVDLEQRSDAIALTAVEAGGRRRTVTARYAVGCDGASSTTRRLAGLQCESFGFEEQWLIFDLNLRQPPPPLPPEAVQVCDPRRPRTELPMPGDRYRFEFMLMPGETADEMLRPEVARAQLLDPLLPPGAAEIERTATYTFQGEVACEWRSGRLLLAGDAAHLMPPFLGQGMCSGFRDAANLAWKLDLAVRHRAPEKLLDTYQAERRPHVAQIIQAAVEFGRIICTTDSVEAARRDRELAADPRPVDARFHFRLPRLGSGPLVLEGGGGLFPQPAAEPGERLDDWVGSRFLVLARERNDVDASGAWWEAGGARVAALDEVPDPDGSVGRWLERSGRRLAVVRPDRYVAATADRLEPVTAALRPWLEEEPV